MEDRNPTDFVPEWRSREIVQDLTLEDDLRKHLASGRVTAYAGFDPTADSLHVGSLLPLLALRRLQLAGHRPIVLVGGGTGLIGDPSGKQGERTLNPAEIVAEWTDRITGQVKQFVDFDCGDGSALLVNNYDWLRKLDTITLLRDIGKHFSVNAMLAKESVSARINRDNAGISYTEFSYMIIQSYDYLVLHREHGCTLQIGGSDQWGNITSGMDLVRRLEGSAVYGLTLPLVTKSDGTKFGKTESGTIWLDAKRTSPYLMYQFWINTLDSDVVRFLNYFTFLPVERIAELAQCAHKHPERREAQRELAREVTRTVHGDAGVAQAERITAGFFSGDFQSLCEDELEQAFRGAEVTALQGVEDVGLVDLVVQTGLAPSKARARELVQSGGLSLNGSRAGDVNARLKRADALFGRYLILRKGKKNHSLAEWK
jgi:tyrosyl-tRNA synthetase